MTSTPIPELVAVAEAIERARNFLVRRQKADGSWSAGVGRYRVGVSSLALLAIINAGLTPADEPVQLQQCSFGNSHASYGASMDVILMLRQVRKLSGFVWILTDNQTGFHTVPLDFEHL